MRAADTGHRPSQGCLADGVHDGFADSDRIEQQVIGEDAVAQGSIKKDPAAELRDALISALIDVQFMNALPDRRLLINLVRRDVVNFPDVQERSEARLHVVEIVLACLGHPGGLRALHGALSTMAPDAPGTKRAGQLIETATLLSLLPESEVKRVHELLRRAE